MKKKVLHLLFSNRYSGAENVACTIIENISNKYDMYYCSPIGPIEEILKERNIKYIPLKKFNLKGLKRVVKEYDFDILFSGHSHNGQVRLPLIGTVYTPVGSKKYYQEYYKLDNREIFISNGIGTSGLDVRFLSSPSINLYRLYK